MSGITNILARPSTLGAIAVAGSGAFYVGLKYRTLMSSEVTQSSKSTRSGGQLSTSQEQSYEVKPGREGGGV